MFLFRNPQVWIPVLLWSIFWKGWALWKAARRDQPLWYIVMLLVNTVGILEIIYLLGFAPRQRDLVSEGRPADLSGGSVGPFRHRGVLGPASVAAVSAS